MSIRVMTSVFQAKITDGEKSSASAKKLVLLALADYVSEDGAGAYPSRQTLSEKTELSDGALSYALKALRQDKLIAKMGTSKYQTILYRLDVDRLEKAARPRKIAPSTIEEPKSTPSTIEEIPPQPLRDAPSTIEDNPLVKPSVKPSVKKAAPSAQEPNPIYQIAVTLAEVCKMDFTLSKGRLLKEAQALSLANPPATPELLKANYNGDPNAFWQSTDWRGKKGQLPTLAAIRETWGQWAKTVDPMDYRNWTPEQLAAEYKAEKERTAARKAREAAYDAQVAERLKKNG